MHRQARTRLRGSTAPPPSAHDQQLETKAPLELPSGRTIAAPAQLAVRIGGLARMLGVSTSTIRRRMKDDVDFPPAFTLTPGTDLMWLVADVEAYLALKAGRAQAA